MEDEKPKLAVIFLSKVRKSYMIFVMENIALEMNCLFYEDKLIFHVKMENLMQNLIYEFLLHVFISEYHNYYC